jgi:hypothetical protein
LLLRLFSMRPASLQRWPNKWFQRTRPRCGCRAAEAQSLFFTKYMNESYPHSSSSVIIAVLTTVLVSCAGDRKAEVRSLEANTLILKYQDFGPQAVSHKLLGMEWYQWNSQGPDDPNATDDVKVAVYRNVPLEEVKRIYPVVKGTQDYSYLESRVRVGRKN